MHSAPPVTRCDVQDVFLRAGLDRGIADTPERNCKANAKGASGLLCCHQCLSTRSELADPTIDWVRLQRTKTLTLQQKERIVAIEVEARRNEECTKLGITLDPVTAPNPYDELHFDPSRQYPTELLHQDLRVSALHCSPASMHAASP